MSELRIVRGNTFWTRTIVTAKDYEGTVIDDFDLSQSTDVVVIIRTAYRNIVMTEWSITGNDLEIKWKDIPTGRYGLDVSGIYDGIEWRFYTENVLDIVNSNAQANIPDDTIIKEDFYAIDGVTMMVTQIGGSNVQSDWEEEDNTKASYIKNKPNLSSYARNVLINGIIHYPDTSGKINLGIDYAKMGWVDNQGFIKEETDPTVPSWAKQPSKPTYNLSEIWQDSTHRTVTDNEKTTWNSYGNKADKVQVYNHGTYDTTFELTPNVFHKWDIVSSLTLTLASSEPINYFSEYMFEFQSGNTATSLSLPSTVKWVENPNIEAHKTYQVSIVDNIAIIVGV